MKLAKLHLDEISEKLDPFAIKNFIISSNAVSMPTPSLDYPFILDGAAFMICIKGSGKIRINFKEYELEENSIITIFPQFVTELLSKSDDLLMEFLLFSTDFLSEMPSSSNLSFDISKSIAKSPCIKATKEEAEKLLDLHSFIVKRYNQKDHPFREAMAKSLLFSLLIEVGAIYYERFVELDKGLNTNQSSSRQEELVSTFFRLLVDHHKEEKNLQYYADKMCLTSKYLSTIIKERTGRTAFAWINEALITSARFMLKTTNFTILQVSEELNFPNASFFGRFFKKHTGMTPVQYKES